MQRAWAWVGWIVYVFLCAGSALAEESQPAAAGPSEGGIGEPVASRLPPGKQWNLVWSDEFDGTELDRGKWGFRLHMMHQRHETWVEDAWYLDGKGHLVLTVYERDGDYFTSQLQTGANFMDRPPDSSFTQKFVWPIAELEPPRFLHKYGYYEIRCKLPTQPGWWAAFWLQSPCIGATLDPGDSGVEIDIMENFTRDGVISHAVHTGGYGKNRQSKGSGPIRLGESPDGFHTFGLLWTPREYVFYADGKETWRIDGPISHREQFILVSAECMGYRREGRPSPELHAAQIPDEFVIDYVRVFDEVP
ncbi:MAG: glycoside hydrolase family 16 protein [Thermogutta sp.]